MFITPEGELARANPSDGRIAWRRKLRTNSLFVPMPLGNSVWMHSSDAPGGRDRLVELDLATGEIHSAVTLPEFGAVGIAAVGRELWVTTPTGKVMVVRG